MAIALQTQPVTANAALQPADVQAILNAFAAVVTLPSGETSANIVALTINVQPTGAGVLNVRFK
jgi:hypothetical protein